MKRSLTRKPIFQKSAGQLGDGDDQIGRVKIYVRLVDSTNHLIKGNVSASWTVAHSRVTEVRKAIEAALFGGV